MALHQSSPNRDSIHIITDLSYEGMTKLRPHCIDMFEMACLLRPHSHYHRSKRSIASPLINSLDL